MPDAQPSATGRRKTSVARVSLSPGSGQFQINGRSLEDYFPRESLRMMIQTPLQVAGVIGKSKYIYDLWGDTVNIASRMESGGVPDSVQVTRPVYQRLKDHFVFESRGAIEVKGKGKVEAWLLRL